MMDEKKVRTIYVSESEWEKIRELAKISRQTITQYILTKTLKTSKEEKEKWKKEKNI